MSIYKHEFILSANSDHPKMNLEESKNINSHCNHDLIEHDPDQPNKSYDDRTSTINDSPSSSSNLNKRIFSA